MDNPNKDVSLPPKTNPTNSKGNYSISRLNATKHGILSRYTVLHGESKDEYERLLNTLVNEHNPNGPTEMHLVEELAGIIWRKRRLRLAEAGCYDGFGAISLSPNIPQYKSENFLQYMPAATPDKVYENFFHQLTKSKFSKVHTVRDALTKIDMALKTISEDKNVSEDEILDILSPHTVNPWNELKEYVKTGESLREKLIFFLRENMTPIYDILLGNLADNNIKIMANNVSTANTDELEKLGRYETTLDRKFERTLGMLLKFKEIRHKLGMVNL